MGPWLEEDHWAQTSEGYGTLYLVPSFFPCLPLSTTRLAALHTCSCRNAQLQPPDPHPQLPPHSPHRLETQEPEEGRQNPWKP